MALGTPNSQAIELANALVDIAQRLVYAAQYIELTLGTTFEAMGTIGTNADGSLGEDDATPNPAHPISPRLYVEIGRLISANDIGSLMTLLQEVSKLLKGQPVAQQGQAPQLLAKLVGGEGEVPTQ
jgi:hypothetical protein